MAEESVLLPAMKQYLSESLNVLEPESYDEVKNAFVDDSTVWKYNG